MPPAPSRCQHILLPQQFSTWQTLVAIVLGAGCVGCWQEVRYEPDKTTRQTLEVSVGESEEMTQELLPAERSEAVFEDSDENSVGDSEVVAVEMGAAETGEVLRDSVVGGLEARFPSAEANSPGVGRTGLAAWEMGSKWSMAVALQAKGSDVARFGEQLEQARESARMLGVNLPELPSYGAGDDRLSQNLTYLLEGAGPRLASELGELHGADHAALVKLAIKTHILLLNYSPSSKKLEPVIDAIRQAAENSRLPEDIWRELVDLLVARADFKQVKAAIYQLHPQVTDYLSDAGK